MKCEEIRDEESRSDGRYQHDRSGFDSGMSGAWSSGLRGNPSEYREERQAPRTSEFAAGRMQSGRNRKAAGNYKWKMGHLLSYSLGIYRSSEK